MKAITIHVARPAATGGRWRVLSGVQAREFTDDPKGRAEVEDYVLALLAQLMHPSAEEPPQAAELLLTQKQAERLAKILHPSAELTSCDVVACVDKAIHYTHDHHFCQRHMDAWGSGETLEVSMQSGVRRLVQLLTDPTPRSFVVGEEPPAWLQGRVSVELSQPSPEPEVGAIFISDETRERWPIARDTIRELDGTGQWTYPGEASDGDR